MIIIISTKTSVNNRMIMDKEVEEVIVVVVVVQRTGAARVIAISIKKITLQSL